MFQTYVVGSLPRPRWVRDLVEDRVAGRISFEDAERLLDAAVPSAIALQERAGLDYVSDGEWRRESYVKVFADAVAGFRTGLHTEVAAASISAPAYPAVVESMVPRRPIALAEAQFLRSHTERRTIVAIPSPYTLGRRLWTPEHSSGAYETREAFIDACVPIIRDELDALAAEGVD
ncbi:MAG: hypothetical protein QF893_08055, partial [Alphaproteobacteria bacterium]|nr:hypothetical protein [Alphaproteobacteria bacterium]